MGDDNFFRHKHLFIFLKQWDVDCDGVLSSEDFDLLAQRFAIYQRHGKFEKDVVDRWRAIVGGWWTNFTGAADANLDKSITFEEWIAFFKNLAATTKSHTELPEFLKMYLKISFTYIDFNKDGLFDIRDYRMLLASTNGDLRRADDAFNSMLGEADKKKQALSGERYYELMYDFWTSSNPNSPGRYICGIYDYLPKDKLENYHRLLLNTK
ncbi:hypothetical protein RvY_12572 [Ramazzottius varieornatus]|uniref:EF-hand domain-containing protein n=1 Tax=Ramazzottius varieornatus TaxID=947166 RepID=A0A1D1VJY5_RAMVA|nr:hypothetical protein RvY_12572 [Ramazzottius varieornatus]